MKKILVFLCLSFMASNVLANKFLLENKTNYPQKGKLGKIAVQWANSAKEVQKANKSILKDEALNSNSLMLLNQKGKIELSSPNNARFFRIVVWSNDKQNSVLLTNWVDINPNKTYVVNQSHLVPMVLMVGAGC